ncbi:hypothetical protein Taro_036792 [Colocasia esculenta]|uniref:Uncharacterized protein n=1 Tax=Colocasia esculenta TaxID=4460 RepID=A0A843WIV7_COLES|nr:hypothetical protein [Colocasia esculenta]
MKLRRPRQELDGKLAAINILSWRQHSVPLTPVGGNTLAAKFFRLWLLVVGVVLRLEMTSRGVRTGVSSRPQHPRVLQYFLHHSLWTMVYSCKVWFRRCRPRLTLRRHCRLSYRLKLRLLLQFLRRMAMVVRPSWRDSRGWLRPLLRGRVSHC